MRAFNTFVLPIITFGSAVWFPRLEKHKILIEKVLRKFTKKIHPSLSYIDRLQTLNSTSLIGRFIIHDLTLSYKIINNISFIGNASFFTFLKSTRLHHHLSSILCRTDKHKHFFSNRIITYYNSISEDSKCSLKLFTNEIDIKFEYHLV